MGWEPPPFLPQAHPGSTHMRCWSREPAVPCGGTCCPVASPLEGGCTGRGDPVNEHPVRADTFGTEATHRAPSRGRGAHQVPRGLRCGTQHVRAHRSPRGVPQEPYGGSGPFPSPRLSAGVAGLPCRTGAKLSPEHPPQELHIFAIHSQTLWPPTLDLPGNPAGCDAAKSFIAS